VGNSTLGHSSDDIRHFANPITQNAIVNLNGFERQELSYHSRCRFARKGKGNLETRYPDEMDNTRHVSASRAFDRRDVARAMEHRGHEFSYAVDEWY
jgi:hypothetical protein